MIDEFTKRRIQDQNTRLTLEQVMEKLKDAALEAQAAGKDVKWVGVMVCDDGEVQCARYGMASVPETLGCLDLMKSEVLDLFKGGSK